jgi:spoIIIJ-associated protein
MRSSEKWGVDVDTAVNLALKDLKLTRDEVDIEVLEESSSGFLGIGSKLARVKVTAKEDKNVNVKEKATFDDIDAILASLPENAAQTLPDEVRADYDKFEAEEREDARAREKANAKSRKRDRDNKKNRKYSLSVEDTMLYEVKKLDPVEGHPVELFLRDIADKMGVNLDFSVKAGDEMVFVEITGKDTGTIIGKRGATLDAVQCLASYVVNKEKGKYTRVILDAENYRSKREKTLVNLANRLAGKVERTKRSVTLEPMNPYERKVIHATLQSNPRVTTRSEGQDPYRRVIIELK